MERVKINGWGCWNAASVALTLSVPALLLLFNQPQRNLLDKPVKVEERARLETQPSTRRERRKHRDSKQGRRGQEEGLLKALVIPAQAGGAHVHTCA